MEWSTIATVMGERVRDETSGRYTDKYPPTVLIETIGELGGTAATSEVADELDAARNTIYKMLTTMEERGEVTGRKAGGIRVWSVQEAEDE